MALRSPCAAGVLLSLVTAAAPAQDGGLYQEEPSNPGIVVMEVESTPPHGDWTVEKTFAGYTFRHYYRWTGPDHFGSPGHGTLGYRFEVQQAGEWFLSLHNRHENADSTLENDVWARMDGGTWFKVYSNGSKTVGVWNWVSRFDLGNHPDASWNLAAGEHLLELSGRSWGFAIDRLHLHLAGHPQSEDTQAPESEAVLGATYCTPATPNSTGRPGAIEARGSTFVQKKDVKLIVTDLPKHQWGYFLAGDARALVQNPGGSQGDLCLGGQLVRFNGPGQLQDSGPTGLFRLNFGVPAAHFAPGETWSMQAWYRDLNPGPTSNLSDAVEVLFQ